MTEKLSRFIGKHSIRGFLDPQEGLALYELAKEVNRIGPCLEIGSYCGKSAIYLGEACRESGNTLYAVDHHRGSEEHQPGEEYHDAALYDSRYRCMDSFPEFRRAMQLAELDEFVVPVVCSSQVLLRHWQARLGLVFVDGGHSHESSMHDCLQWSPHISPGAFLAIHDVYQNESEGGQGPRLAMEEVLKSEDWVFVDQVLSLAILRRRP